MFLKLLSIWQWNQKWYSSSSTVSLFSRNSIISAKFYFQKKFPTSRSQGIKARKKLTDGSIKPVLIHLIVALWDIKCTFPPNLSINHLSHDTNLSQQKIKIIFLTGTETCLHSRCEWRHLSANKQCKQKLENNVHCFINLGKLRKNNWRLIKSFASKPPLNIPLSVQFMK